MKNYKVQQVHRGQYIYQIQGVKIYLEFDAEQTNGMVAGGFGMWKAYPMRDREVLWDAPFESDVDWWYDRKREFTNELINNPQAILEDARTMIAKAVCGTDQTFKNFVSGV